MVSKGAVVSLFICLCLLFCMPLPVSADAYDTFLISATPGVPIVVTNESTNVEETSATLHGYLLSDAGLVCQYRFQYDIDAGEPYTTETTWAGAINEGQPFSEGVVSLTKGELYFFRAQCRNGSINASGAEKTFLTKPDAPSSFDATSNTTYVRVDLTWTKGDGADRTVIVKKQDSYPVDRLDGTVVYNGTASHYEDSSVTVGNRYYYRAWSYCSEGGLYRFSDNYDGDFALVLAPAEFDLRSINILDNIINDLIISIVVENQGDVASDITVSWVLSRVDNHVVLDMGSDTFAVSPHIDLLHIVYPSTSYIGWVNISFVGDGASAYYWFYTESITTGGGGGYYPPPRVEKEEKIPVAPVAPTAAFDASIVFCFLLVILLFLIFFIIWRRREEEEEKKKKRRRTRS